MQLSEQLQLLRLEDHIQRMHQRSKGFGGETMTFRPVLTGIDNVMQIAVLEEFGIVVVLVGEFRKFSRLVSTIQLKR